MIRVRQALRELEPYRPGKPAELVARAHGIQDVVKLSSNENPYPPLPSVQDTIARAASEINRYPDDDCTALRDALAARYAVGTERVTVGCGSIDVCYQAVLATIDPGDEMIFGWPSFDAFRLLARLADADAQTVPLRDERYDLDAIARQISDRTRLVIICNPNNPTGTAVARADLEAFLQKVPSELLVVIDEAYHEFVDDPDFPDGLEAARQHDNVMVLRTFSKAHGLAGLRVGYGIASPEVISVLRRVHIPFAVNRVAQAAALASLEAQDELRERVAGILAERRRVAGALTSLGFPTTPSQANFVSLPLPGSADEAASECEARGVGVRPIGRDAIRVTVGTPVENDRFLEAFTEVADVVRADRG